MRRGEWDDDRPTRRRAKKGGGFPWWGWLVLGLGILIGLAAFAREFIPADRPAGRAPTDRPR